MTLQHLLVACMTLQPADFSPLASTGFSNSTFSPCCENMSSILPLSTLSKVTAVRLSNRPDWKWGTTLGGSLPRDRISSSVGSDTK